MDSIRTKKSKNILYINAVGDTAIDILQNSLGGLMLGSPRISHFKFHGLDGIKVSYVISDELTMEMVRSKLRKELIDNYSDKVLLLYQNSYNLFVFDKFNF